MKKNSRQNLRKITVMAMLAAVAVVSVYFIKFPLLPSAAFLEYDIADVPVLIGTMLFGPSAGLVILLITSAIQAFTVSSSSHIIGFLMHFCASGVLVLASGLMYKKSAAKRHGGGTRGRLGADDTRYDTAQSRVHRYFYGDGCRSGRQNAHSCDNPVQPHKSVPQFRAHFPAVYTGE